MVQNVISGLLNGTLNGSQATELDVIDLTDSQIAEVISGLGAYKSHPRYNEAVSRAVSSLAKRNKRNTIQIRKPDSKDMTGKAKFEKRISQIENDDIRRGLANGTYTIADYEVYAIKKADSDTVDMFLSSDDRASGVTNINKGQLNNREAMLITHVVFQEGIAAAPTGDPKVDGASVDFKKITSNTANGDFNFKNGQKIFSERASMDIFKRGESESLRSGEIELEVPKLVQEAKDIIFETKLPATPAADTYFKVMLKGVIVIKA
ncbi:MAG: hypothetical protein L3J56_00500 [Bacteroidales bacterium]|nr:hypothetical protein [Bacteroidales bacterium]